MDEDAEAQGGIDHALGIHIRGEVPMPTWLFITHILSYHTQSRKSLYNGASQQCHQPPPPPQFWDPGYWDIDDLSLSFIWPELAAHISPGGILKNIYIPEPSPWSGHFAGLGRGLGMCILTSLGNLLVWNWADILKHSCQGHLCHLVWPMDLFSEWKCFKENKMHRIIREPNYLEIQLSNL